MLSGVKSCPGKPQNFAKLLQNRPNNVFSVSAGCWSGDKEFGDPFRNNVASIFEREFSEPDFCGENDFHSSFSLHGLVGGKIDKKSKFQNIAFFAKVIIERQPGHKKLSRKGEKIGNNVAIRLVCKLLIGRAVAFWQRANNDFLAG